MSKTRVLILIVCLLVIGAFVLFLSGGTETAVGTWVFGGSGFAPAILFFICFGAMAGVMKIFVDAVLPKNMSPSEGKGWERTRKSGKRFFILTATVIGGIPVILGLPVHGLLEGSSSEVTRNLTIAALVLIGGFAAIANALWNYQEANYLKAKEKEKARPTI